jgi:Protein of unknwon function (DUF3310)
MPLHLFGATMRRTMPLMPEPFDVTTIDDTGEQEAHDALRAGPSHISPTGGPDPLRDLRRLAQGPAHTPEAVPEAPAEDAINPNHYRKHPSGIECIEVTRHMNFNVGNAIKYLWRYMDKGDAVENLKKAQWYIDDEIRRLQGLR